jgi:phytoene dehydrogenase-like protein
MIPALESLPGSRWPARKEALRSLLLLDRPVPEDAARRAFADDRFASLLLLSRHHPDLLQLLLEAPANRRYARSDKPPRQRGAIRLGFKAGASLARWAAGGFATLPAEAVAARLAVCRTCPELGPPPKTIAYGLKLSAEVDMSTCRACGCVVRRKARLSHERCPKELWPAAAPNRGGET